MELDTIQCGNSDELLKTLPSESVDFVLTSPPYDNLRSYNGYVKMATERVKAIQPPDYLTYDT